MKKLFFLMVIFFAVCGQAFAGQKVSVAAGADIGADASASARRALDDLFAAYKRYVPMTFDKLISPDVPLRTEFINNIEKGVLAGPVIDLNYFNEGVVQEGASLAVKIRWEKKIQSRAEGKQVSSKGNAELAFKKLSGKWLLYEIKGDNPLF